jgi:hypothetical protein
MGAGLTQLIRFPRPYLAVSGGIILQIPPELSALQNFDIAAKLRVIAKTASMSALVIFTNHIAY